MGLNGWKWNEFIGRVVEGAAQESQEKSKMAT
jgi:hypothetical protein